MTEHRVDFKALRSALVLTSLPGRIGRTKTPPDRWCVFTTSMRAIGEPAGPCDTATRTPERIAAARACVTPTH
jgi:hypothetical protein